MGGGRARGSQDGGCWRAAPKIWAVPAPRSRWGWQRGRRKGLFDTNAVPDPRDRRVFGVWRGLWTRQRSHLFGCGRGRGSSVLRWPSHLCLHALLCRLGVTVRGCSRRRNGGIVSVRLIAPGALCLNPPFPGYTKGTLTGSLLAAPRVCARPLIPASTSQTVALLSGRVKHACHRGSPSSLLLLAQGCGGNTSRSGVLLDDLGGFSPVALLFLWKKQALPLAGSGGVVKCRICALVPSCHS